MPNRDINQRLIDVGQPEYLSKGGGVMYTYGQSAKIHYSIQDPVDDPFHHIRIELVKKNQFLNFLQKELDMVKTETEKEAVLSILLKTKIQIKALEKVLKDNGELKRKRRRVLNRPLLHQTHIQRLQ